MNYAYIVYGLICSSNAPLSGLARLKHSQTLVPDVLVDLSVKAPGWVQGARKLPSSICYGKSSLPGLPEACYTVTTFDQGRFFEVTYEDDTRFVLEGGGARLWATCPPLLTRDDLAVYLRGPILGLILQLRGVVTLHASVVVIQDQAVLFCGPSESGKSTLAAALALKGYPVISDDLAPLRYHHDIFEVAPGYPRICLWPESVSSLFGEPERLPRLTPNWDKRFLALDSGIGGFRREKCPLGAIYLLASRSDSPAAPQVAELASTQALLALVQNTHMNWFLDRKQRAAEFEVLSRLVTRVPLRRLVPHRDLDQISQLCAYVVADAERLLTGHTSVGSNV